MKLKRIFSLIAFAVLGVCMAFTASAANEQPIGDSIYFMANAQDAATVVNPQRVNGSYYLFLPSSADLSQLVLFTEDSYKSVTLTGDNTAAVVSGSPFDFESLFNYPEEQDGEYTVTAAAYTAEGVYSKFEFTVMKSANLRSMYLVSDDPVAYGRGWVEQSKSNEATGLVALISETGEVDYSNALTQLKCRGNSTFTDFVKKAYQIKIDKKADLIANEKSEENKKWVLLANAADMTLIHNSLTFALAQDLNMAYSPRGESIDLYYDGEYRGTYLLAEKNEVDSSKIDIQDLDGLIEDLNADTDAYENPVVVTKTTASGGETEAAEAANGSYKYVDGLIEPPLAEGTTHHGYFLEIDFIYRYADEQTGFVSNRGQAVVTKDPEYLTKETGAFISSFWQEFEDAVYSANGFNADTGKFYYDYCDLDSLVKLYLVNELGKNYDSFRSSTFFYLPEDEDIMYAGPIWDYDICYGTGYNGNRQTAGNPENFFASTKYMLNQLLKIESFRDAVKATLDSENGEFYAAVMNMLGENGNIAKFSAEVYESQKMNYKLWDISDRVITALFCDDDATYDNGIDFLQWYISERIDWLSETTSQWSGSSYTVKTDPSYSNTAFNRVYRYHNIVTDPAVAPTCTETGLTEGSHCAGCGTVYRQQKEVAATGHTWEAASCTKPQTCFICGEIQGTALGHTWVDGFCSVCGVENCGDNHIWVDATCTAPVTCSVCGDIRGEALGHTWVDATCGEAKTCSVCGRTEGRPLDHDWAAATCAVPETCTLCGETRGETLEHEWIHATCAAPETCTLCGETRGEAKEHIWTEATCRIPMTCSVCGTTRGEALGHDFVADPQHDLNSEICLVYKCTRCGVVSFEAIDPDFVLGDLNGDKVITAADARLALRLAAKLDPETEENRKAADIDLDGQVTAADARLLLRKAAHLD